MAIPIKIFILFPFALFLALTTFGQNGPDTVANIPVNYKESAVPTYELPDALVMENGQAVTTATLWREKRRPEILKLFETQQFGTVPERNEVSFHVFEIATPALHGMALRKQITVYFTKDTTQHKADVVIYTPIEAKKSVPLLLKIGFAPNCLTVDDPGIKEGKIRTREGRLIPATEGRSFGFFPVRKFMDQGIGVAYIYYGDIEPDFPGGIQYGIRGYYLRSDQSWPDPDQWGAISA